MQNIRTHIVVDSQLTKEVDNLVGKRKRSDFFQRAVINELKRLKAGFGLQAAVGIWSGKEHKPTEQKLKNLRKSWDR